MQKFHWHLNEWSGPFGFWEKRLCFSGKKQATSTFYLYHSVQFAMQGKFCRTLSLNDVQELERSWLGPWSKKLRRFERKRNCLLIRLIQKYKYSQCVSIRLPFQSTTHNIRQSSKIFTSRKSYWHLNCISGKIHVWFSRKIITVCIFLAESIIDTWHYKHVLYKRLKIKQREVCVTLAKSGKRKNCTAEVTILFLENFRTETEKKLRTVQRGSC